MLSYPIVATGQASGQILFTDVSNIQTNGNTVIVAANANKTLDLYGYCLTLSGNATTTTSDQVQIFGPVSVDASGTILSRLGRHSAFVTTAANNTNIGNKGNFTVIFNAPITLPKGAGISFNMSSVLNRNLSSGQFIMGCWYTST